MELLLEEILKKYKKFNYDREEMEKALQAEIDEFDGKFIVLDDDPTGVQTVHDINVFTDWSVESLKEGLLGEEKLFFVLTNSRGLTEEQTTVLHKELAHNAISASQETGRKFVLVSRSDSTLRGHFPLETKLLAQVLKEEAGQETDGEVLMPFFKEGGRFTIGNVHYVKDGEKLVPAAETEFAKDKTFGYSHSYLPDYIEEKTKGDYPADRVTCISLEELRGGQVEEIQEKLTQVSGFGKVVVNALDYEDITVFAVALYRAMKAGKTFLFRSAAGLVKVLGGISTIPLLTADKMCKHMFGNPDNHGGIIVVGSHTKKTTSQLEALRSVEGLTFLEFDSDQVLSGTLSEEVDRVVGLSEEIIKKGGTVVAYTKRKLLEIEGDTPEAALKRSVQISEGVQALVGRLSVEPAFVIAKGGITSSDVGVKALKVKKARVLGQIRPGIPVWQTGEESKFPGIPYVIFPGNVGDENTLKEAVEILLK